MYGKGIERTGTGCPPPFPIPLPLWTEKKDGLAQRRRGAEESLRVSASLRDIPFPAGGRGTSTKSPERSAVGVRVLRDCVPKPEGSQRLAGG